MVSAGLEGPELLRGLEDCVLGWECGPLHHLSSTLASALSLSIPAREACAVGCFPPSPSARGRGEGTLGYPRAYEFIENPHPTPPSLPPPSPSLGMGSGNGVDNAKVWQVFISNGFGTNVFPEIPQLTLDRFPAPTPES